MADIRIKDLATTASSAASDDFMALDGATNGTRKMSAANPSVTTLTTSGVITPGGSVHGANGAVGNPSFAFASDQNTGLYRIGTNNIGVAANGSKVLDIATTGLTVTGAVTATTTLADQGGTIAAQRNGLAPVQGLAQNGAVSTLTVPAFGTNDWFVSVITRLNDGYLFLANANGPSIGGGSGTYVFLDKQNVANVARWNTPTITGNNRISISVVAGYAYCYLDGAQLTINNAFGRTTSGNGIYVAADNFTGVITSLSSAGSPENTFSGIVIENRGLSAAEVLALYQSGAPAGADYNTASNTALNTTAFVNSSVVPYTTFSGSSATGFTATKTTVANARANMTGSTFNTTIGQKFRLTYTLVVNSGTAPQAYLGIENVVATSAASTLVAGVSQTVDLTAIASTTGAYLQIGNTAIQDFVLSNVSLVRLGLLLAPDSNNAGAGLEWLDVSGNRAHIVLPTSGVSWSLPSSQQIVIEASTSTNGNQQLGGASLIDANKQWRIQSWTVNCSTGTPTISLGNVSAGAQFVSGAVMASGNNDITLVTRFPSTANLWVNSNSTATLIHRITLVPAN